MNLGKVLTKKIDICSGCKACENICPAACLKINTYKPHFYMELDETKCIKCGKCELVCPMKHSAPANYPIAGYNAHTLNPAVARRSSSGGIATSLYRYCLKHDMACVGVRYSDNLQLVYDFVNSVADIREFSGSKYVYSDMGNIYKRISELLKNGEIVVFVGLPCHVSAISNYLHENQKKTLILVDLVCDGIPMRLFFDEHIKNLQQDMGGETIRRVNFREKENEFGFTARNNSGWKVYEKSGYADEYMFAFMSSIDYCSGCYECRYAAALRCSDMTIKDCSSKKVESYMRTGNASSILVNSEKGLHFWNRLKTDCNIISKEYPVPDIIKEDKRLNHPAGKSERMKFFWKMVGFLGFDRTVKIIRGISGFDIMHEFLKPYYVT